MVVKVSFIEMLLFCHLLPFAYEKICWKKDSCQADDACKFKRRDAISWHRQLSLPVVIAGLPHNDLRWLASQVLFAQICFLGLRFKSYGTKHKRHKFSFFVFCSLVSSLALQNCIQLPTNCKFVWPPLASLWTQVAIFEILLTCNSVQCCSCRYWANVEFNP